MSEPSVPAARTLEDPLAEALRIVAAADQRGLLVRLMGGMAVRAHAPEWTHRTRRLEVDLDFATRSKDRHAFYELLEAEGYTPDKQHNALFGRNQAYFVDVPRKRPVDLPLAELLLSKLQVVRINRKDVLDALILLAEHELGVDDGAPVSGHGLGKINVSRIVQITSNDWGWWRTVTGNLEKLDQFITAEMTPEDLDIGPEPVTFDPADQVRALREAIDAAPKSTRWKLRARVGDKVTWYALPEEINHGS
jgi:hypothetical protein